MDKNIYNFIFYPVFFALFESIGFFMLCGNSKFLQFFSWENAEQQDFHLTEYHQFDSQNRSGTGKIIDFNIFPGIQFGNLVFNELMADPTPVVKLPDAEFLELKNTSNIPINISNWVLEVNGRQKVLGDKTIPPGSYLILGGTGGHLIWGNYGDNLEVPGLVLANDGVNLKLFSAANSLIDSFNYMPSMHRKGFSGGGYSLERIDPNRRCGNDLNWETSKAANGGTPGIVNSAFRDNPDNSPPAVISIIVLNPSLLEIIVSEIPGISSIKGDFFDFTPIIPIPDSIRFDRVLKKYSIYFPAEAIKNGVSYDLIINGIMDECGNISPVEHHEFMFFLPKPGDLLISEVLFNPFPEGVDFVEIYNHSGRNIKLDEVSLASLDNVHKIKTYYPLSVTPLVLSDASYATFTSDVAVLVANYTSECPGCIFKMEKLPAYNIDEGWVVLINKEMEIIDEFHYYENMHHPMISDVKGISLERNSFSKPSDDPSNWHSASKTVGFATPGYQNSSRDRRVETKEMVTIEPKIFSPNDDGINDRLLIKLSPGEPDWMVNIRIFNENGLEIRRLANNLMIGTEDIVEWDGTTEKHQKAGLGIYIIKTEFFGLQSRRKQFKAACVITDRKE